MVVVLVVVSTFHIAMSRRMRCSFMATVTGLAC